MRLKSLSKKSIDGVPRSDEGATTLIIGLSLALVAVGYVAWHYASTFLTGARTKPRSDTPSESARSPIENLALSHDPFPTAFGYDPSGRYLIPFQVSGGGDPMARLKDALDAPTAPPGMERLLPAGTTLRGLTREGSTVTVDLTADTLALAGGAPGEDALLGALTHAMLSIEGVSHVQFLVDGQKAQYTADGVELGAPWTAASAGPINPTPLASGTETGLFYALDDSAQYLVPIELPYDAAAPPLEAKLQRLLEGPPPGSDLRSVFPEDLRLEKASYEESTGTLVLDLATTASVQEWAAGLPHPEHVIQAIVLTIHDLEPVERLELTINGIDVWATATFADVRSKAAAVSRINPIPVP